MYERIFYGTVEYESFDNFILMDRHIELACGWIFKEFKGKRVKITITELSSQENKIMSKVQELVIA